MLVKSKESIEPVPEGKHPGICVGIIDLGTRRSERFNTKNRSVLFQFELRDQIHHGFRRTISRMYSYTISQKAKLREHLESWRGKSFTREEERTGFNLKEMLGKPVEIQILHVEKDGRTYDRISNLIASDIEEIKPDALLVYFSFDDGLDVDLPETIPDWVRDIMKESDEYKMIMDARKDNITYE
jgi:hypothetical protein